MRNTTIRNQLTCAVFAMLALSGCGSSTGVSESEAAAPASTTSTPAPTTTSPPLPEPLDTSISIPSDFQTFPEGPVVFLGEVATNADSELAQVLFVIRSGLGTDDDPFLWWNADTARFQVEFIQQAADLSPDGSWAVTWDSTGHSGDFRFSARATSRDGAAEEIAAGVSLSIGLPGLSLERIETS